MRKKLLSLALALVMCLGLTVPAFAAESKWNVEVSGKSNAQVFVGEKSFTLRDCGRYDYDYITKDEVFYKEDDLQWTAKNVCVLEKGDTAVFTYTYRSQESTGQGAFSGGGMSSIPFQMIAWSDPDGDGVYDARLIKERVQDNYDYEEDGYCDLLPENWYEVLPTGFDVKNNPTVAWQYQSSWSELVGIDEKLNYEEVRLSADRVLELFGPNTLVGIYDGGIFTSDPADMDWFILVEGNTTQPTGGPQVSDWAKEQVNRAAEIGLVPDGLGNDYRVSITRAQFAATAVKLYEAMSGQKAPAAGESPFSDTSDPAVIQAQALGIVNGVGDDKFAADALVTREQAAAMLSRVYTKLGGNIPEVAATTFADNDKVSSWAKGAVAFMADKGIVSGVGNNSFDPLGNASIEQALVIALRMFDNLK